MLSPPVFQLIALNVILTFPGKKKKKQLEVENLEPMSDGCASYLVLGRCMSVTNQNEMGRSSWKWCLKNDHINALNAGRTLEPTEDAIDVLYTFSTLAPRLPIQRGPCACSTPW